MLAANPEIAVSGFASAVVLGDVARVREAIEGDLGLVSRPDPLSDGRQCTWCAPRDGIGWTRLGPAAS